MMIVLLKPDASIRILSVMTTMFVLMILVIARADVYTNQKKTLTAMITMNVPLKNVTLRPVVNIII
jgi:hypothetical protein